MWTWIKNAYNSFEAWVYSWMPGFKTKLVAGVGALGSLAGVLQQYITGLPLSEFATSTQIAVLTTVLFTLAFWFKDMGVRVANAA